MVFSHPVPQSKVRTSLGAHNDPVSPRPVTNELGRETGVGIQPPGLGDPP